MMLNSMKNTSSPIYWIKLIRSCNITPRKHEGAECIKPGFVLSYIIPIYPTEPGMPFGSLALESKR